MVGGDPFVGMFKRPDLIAGHFAHGLVQGRPRQPQIGDSEIHPVEPPRVIKYGIITAAFHLGQDLRHLLAYIHRPLALVP